MKKIKKGIILLSMVMVIISTMLPVTSSAADEVHYTTSDIKYEVYNGDTAEGQNAFLSIFLNMDKISKVRFVAVQLEENSEVIYPIRGENIGSGSLFVYFNETEEYPKIQMSSSGNINYYDEPGSGIKPYKLTVYNIIEFVPTPSPVPTPTPSPSPTPSPTPDERVVNLLDETGNGIGTILTWVGDLWESIVSGDMSAILPLFAIFVIIPIILLVIKIIRKSTWGD